MDETQEQEIIDAANEYGLDPVLLKAVIIHESHGDWGKNSRIVRFSGRGIHPYVGITTDSAKVHGIDFDGLEGDRAKQVLALSKILRELRDRAINDMILQSWYSGQIPYPGFSVDGYVGSVNHTIKSLKE
jgi:hypothetical protein